MLRVTMNTQQCPGFPQHKDFTGDCSYVKEDGGITITRGTKILARFSSGDWLRITEVPHHAVD